MCRFIRKLIYLAKRACADEDTTAHTCTPSYPPTVYTIFSTIFQRLTSCDLIVVPLWFVNLYSSGIDVGITEQQQ